MADGSVRIDVGMSTSKAEKELEKLKEKISKLETDLNEKSERKSALEQKMESSEKSIERARQKIKKLKEEIASTGSRSEKAALRERLAETTENYRSSVKDQDARAREYQKLRDDIDKGRKSLIGMKEEAGNMEKVLAETSEKVDLSGKFDAAKKKLKSFIGVAFGITTAVKLFQVLKKSIVDSVKEFAQYDEETAKNIQGLKNSLAVLKVSWGAAFAPIFNAVVPLLQKLIGWLTSAANAIAQFFAILGGRPTYKRAIANNDDLADSISGVGGAAKEANRQLMAFDELNVLNGDSGGGGGGNDGIDLEEVGVEVGDNFATLLELVKSHLGELELVALGAMAGIGIALLLTGHIALGVGMLIASGLFAKYVVAENWDTIVEKCGGTLGAIELVAIGALLGVGLVLALTGANLPLGLGMIAAGALGMAAYAAIKWDDMPTKLKGVIGEIMFIVGGAMLALGLILTLATPAFSPLGIGLIALGAASLAAGAAINWNSTTATISSVVRDIIAIASGASIAIGILLALTGANLPLGLALIIAGTAGVAATVNWDALGDKIKEVLGNIKENWTTFWSGIRDETTQIWDMIKTAIGDKIDGIRASISEKWNSLKQWWEGLRLSSFKVMLPHLSWSWREVDGIVGRVLSTLGLPSQIPSLNVAWYARGGIVDAPTLFGAGEAGKEAIVPLEQHTEWINLVANGIIDRMLQSDFANRLADAFATTPMPAMAGGYVVPRNAAFAGFGDNWGRDVLSEIAALRSEISALSRQPVEVSTQMVLDRREIGRAVTVYQRQEARSTG